MSELNKNGMEQMSDNELSEVAGGMTRNLAAAYDVMNNVYGVGDERRRRLEAAGYNYWEVQHLVNGLAMGYDSVAKDVIAGKYGNGAARVNALQAAGYNPTMVQDIVNGFMY
ncbi:MAG: hypothetical protein ABS900_08080 [Candidatus Limivicinus sp.]